MYRSVGKESGSVSTVMRPGRRREAATTTLDGLTEVESVAAFWPGAAPTSSPMRSPARSGGT